MDEISGTPLEIQGSVRLKLGETEVDVNDPWADDLLGRQEVATRLTNLVATQEPPLSISLHGPWGTGKTFMLKRWQKALEKEGYHAIYFNAWEDDFCDQPLLAIIGQLSEYFKDTRFKAIAQRLAELAVPLIEESVLATVRATTGLAPNMRRRARGKRSLLESYQNQRLGKDVLKKHLKQLAARVASSKEQHPLIFIVDELDRCRPTFAIELLERVKHIFDVPHLVFVFGLNRDELCKSLCSIYGDIRSDVYLRRFFDFDFELSEVDSRGFAIHLMDELGIGLALESLSARGTQPEYRHDYNNYRSALPILWSGLALPLREIDYGMRLLALLTRNIPVGQSTHPFLLSILIAMKFKNANLYRSLKNGHFRTSEIMDYVEAESRPEVTDSMYTACLDRIEGFLYCADSANDRRHERGGVAEAELNDPPVIVTPEGERKPNYQVLSRRAQAADENQRRQILQAISDGRWNLRIEASMIRGLAKHIDTSQEILRR